MGQKLSTHLPAPSAGRWGAGPCLAWVLSPDLVLAWSRPARHPRLSCVCLVPLWPSSFVLVAFLGCCSRQNCSSQIKPSRAEGRQQGSVSSRQHGSSTSRPNNRFRSCMRRPLTRCDHATPRLATTVRRPSGKRSAFSGTTVTTGVAAARRFGFLVATGGSRQTSLPLVLPELVGHRRAGPAA